ncbi:hypothetical protein ACTU46_15115 [Corynebacterium sp. A21]
MNPVKHSCLQCGSDATDTGAVCIDIHAVKDLTRDNEPDTFSRLGFHPYTWVTLCADCAEDHSDGSIYQIPTRELISESYARQQGFFLSSKTWFGETWWEEYVARKFPSD